MSRVIDILIPGPIRSAIETAGETVSGVLSDVAIMVRDAGYPGDEYVVSEVNFGFSGTTFEYGGDRTTHSDDCITTVVYEEVKKPERRVSRARRQRSASGRSRTVTRHRHPAKKAMRQEQTQLTAVERSGRFRRSVRESVETLRRTTVFDGPTRVIEGTTITTGFSEGLPRKTEVRAEDFVARLDEDRKEPAGQHGIRLREREMRVIPLFRSNAKKEGPRTIRYTAHPVTDDARISFADRERPEVRAGVRPVVEDSPEVSRCGLEEYWCERIDELNKHSIR